MESDELNPKPIPEPAAVPSVSENFEAQIKELIEYLIEAKKKLTNKLLGEPAEDEVKVPSHDPRRNLAKLNGQNNSREGWTSQKRSRCRLAHRWKTCS